jgi:uncharacterized membrane protein YfcA
LAELLLLMGGGMAAGVFGALLGLGGGVLIVPLLTFAFGLPLREAVGVSLICVIVTSSAAAAVYLERQVANLRLGMTLELFTATAALAGGLVAFALPEKALALLFAALLVYVAAVMVRGTRTQHGEPSADRAVLGSDFEAGVPVREVGDGSAGPAPRRCVSPSASDRAGTGLRAQTGSTYLDRLSGPGYRVRNLKRGIAGSLLAGVVSALLGIGGGIVKVPLMNLAMGVPLRVAAATSNLMIGVTASAGGLVYFFRGGIDPYIAAPTAVGVFVGAGLASRLAHRVNAAALRVLFVAVLLLIAVQMMAKGLA